MTDESPTRACIWRSCSLRSLPTTALKCPECGTPTEPDRLKLAEAEAAAIAHELELSKPPARPMIVTMNDIPNRRITEVHGDVFGLVVMSRDYFTNLGARFRTFTGGEVRGYTELLRRSRNGARARLWAEATELGANAVVAFRFDCTEIGGIMSEVAAYGTAVTVEPV